jgi:short-subunit dehydrogenase
VAAVRPFAVVTGGSSGIGLAVARLLVARGFEVELWARGAGRLEAAVADLGGQGRGVAGRVCDVADPAAVESAAQAVLRARPTVSLLVGAAGVPGRRSALDTDVESARRVMEVNYLGLVAVTHGLWPGLVAARGQVVNICSVAGTVALAKAAPYAASKHAAVAWSRSLAAAAPRAVGVRVLTVNPGPVATAGFPQTALVAHPVLRRVVLTDVACAEAVLRALDAGRTEVFVPGWWRVVGVLQALAPGLVARVATRAYR